MISHQESAPRWVDFNFAPKDKTFITLDYKLPARPTVAVGADHV